MRSKRNVLDIALGLASLAAVACSSGCFALPHHETEVPAQVAVALAGGDPSSVDPNGPPMRIRSVWLDRQIALFVDHQADGAHQLDFQQTDDTTNGLQARVSDNARNQANVAAVSDLLGQLLLSALAARVPAAAASGTP